MTPQIKHRIEQIRQGEVPDEYKKTKVGIIPMDWGTTCFKKKFDRLMRKNTDGNTNVLTISAQYGLVNQEEFFNKSVASDDKTNYFLLYQGEYAYNKSYSNGYPFGAIKKLDKYEKGIVSPLYICFSAGKDNKCPEYYLQYFEAGGMNSEIQAFAQEGARNHGLLNISVDDFFNSILVEPPLAEQERIAEILETQDRVIELCEKKVEQLKKLKKMFLQKMFPKPGATVPEWRFPEFTDAWEQRKLSDVVTEIKRTDENSGAPVMMITAENGFINQSERYSTNNAGQSLKKYILLEKGELAYNHGASKLRPYGSCFALTTEERARIPFVYHCFSTDTENPEFLSIVLNGKAVEKQLRRIVSSGARMDGLLNISFDEYTSIPILLPQRDEQNRIADCFRHLDHLITLHQCKCDEEKQKKKALMQLLLTGIVRIK